MKHNSTIQAILLLDIEYTDLLTNKLVIIKKDTPLLVDTKHSVALVNDTDHIDISDHEYRPILLN